MTKNLLIVKENETLKSFRDLKDLNLIYNFKKNKLVGYRQQLSNG